jgi:hypothetical protein
MNLFPTIGLTNFVHRQFDPGFKGTYIDTDPYLFEMWLNAKVAPPFREQFRDGYAPFCKHLIFPIPKGDFTIKAPVLALTPENESHLRSGYEARREGELPVLARWFEGVEAPKAKFLDVILYSREHLLKEAAFDGEPVIDEDWGVVAILGLLTDEEQPMPPATMLRNALGISEGGSGVALDKDAYQKSVEFWSKHAIVKP